MNADGTNQVRLTNNPDTDCFPAFSPNGRKIAFVSQNASGGFAVKLMNADGTNQTTVTPIAFAASPYPWHEKWSLSWSPDGGKIAFDENGEIISVNVDGSNRTNLTNHPASDSEPSWSPDGSQIIFVSSRVYWLTMHTMNTNGSDLRALPDADELWDMSPDWSPTGNKIAFVVHSEIFLPILYTANADGTNRQPFDGCGNGLCSTHRNKPKWSPDATKMVFHIWEYFSNDAEIYVKNVDGSGFAQLTNTAGSNFHPSWQPLAPAQPFADFDGDGRAELAVYRNGIWWSLNLSNNQTQAIHFGIASDKPVVADYDGDGRADQAVYRGSGEWHLNRSSQGYTAVNFGLATDKPVVGDYDGDGKADEAVYRDGVWYLLQSSQGFAAFQFGLSSDIPAPANYDGDGRTDATVFRNGTWYIIQSSTGNVSYQYFGLSGDIPLIAANTQ